MALAYSLASRRLYYLYGSAVAYKLRGLGVSVRRVKSSVNANIANSRFR